MNSVMHVGLHERATDTTRWYWVQELEGRPPELVHVATEVASIVIENALEMERQQLKDAQEKARKASEALQ